MIKKVLKMAELTGNEEYQLLNLKQAARMLNVSAVSLRRWAKSGKLGCMRVGPKRELRFRQEDISAFVEAEDASQSPVEAHPLPASKSHEILEDMAVDHGSHLCVVYESDLGQLKIAVPFLADGLEAGETCCLIAAPEDRKRILDQLGTVRSGLADDIRGGRLVMTDGEGSVDAMLGFLEDLFVKATRSGHGFIRVLADVAWRFGKGIDQNELREFEMRYSQSLARRFPLVTVCQYDARRFSGVDVLNALKCHEDTFRYPISRFLN